MQHHGFIVNTAGVTIALEFSDAVAEAYDIMAADNVPADRCAAFALEAEKSGRDPVEFARHFVHMRRAFREHRS